MTRKERLIVDELSQTCSACPAQWEGRLRDGRWIYVRYRWGYLQIGVGETLSDAVNDDDTFGVELGDSYDGFLDYSKLIAATQDVVSWPCSAERITP